MSNINLYCKLPSKLKKFLINLLIVTLFISCIEHAAGNSFKKMDSYNIDEQPQNRGTMVLIEGLDLAGKSTLTKNLIQQLKNKNYKISYSKNALVPNNPIAAKADILRKEPNAGLLESGSLFLASHLYDIKTFKYPPKNTIHIQDSSWLRTISYHLLNDTRWIAGFVKEISIYQPKFDVVVYLTASTQLRRERVLQREKESGENDKADYMSWFNPVQVEKHDKLLFEQTLEYYPHAYKIDTTNMTADQVCDHVLELIKEKLKNNGGY